MKKTSKKLDHHMPADLIEPILLKLPVKSLFRFSTASKLWNSIIFGPKFSQSYRGREMIVFKSLRRNDDGYLTYDPPLACPLSSVSSDNPTDGTTSFDCPFQLPGSYLASCGNLWCVKFEKSLLLYNPTIQTYRKLPANSSFTSHEHFVYGLGYDSVGDDYKILKIHVSLSCYEMNEIYSLRSDCWRKLESKPPYISKFLSKKGLFASGKVHWLITSTVWIKNVGKSIEKNYILSFDLSEEKFGRLIELPELLPKQRDFRCQVLGMIVFGGKLRVHLSCVNHTHYCNFCVWVMEDYESKLWTKEMEFDYGHMPPPLCYADLRPFYFYDDAGNLVRAVTSANEREKMFIYKDQEVAGSASSTPTLVEKNFGSIGFGLTDSLTYVESFVSPLTWHGSTTKADDDDDDDDDDDGSSRKMEELKLSS